VRAGLRGGRWIFFGKTTRFAQTSFSGKKYTDHPAPTGIGGNALVKNHGCFLAPLGYQSIWRCDRLSFPFLSLFSFNLVFLCCSSVGGCGVFFWQGKNV